jgi:predicted RNA-binding protein
MNEIKNISFKKNLNTNAIKNGVNKRVRTELQTLSQDTFEISSSSKENTKKISLKIIPFKTKDAYVLLTERTAADSKIDRSILSQLNGYTDANGNILPYLFVEGLSVYDKGKGIGKNIMEEIIKIAKEKYGGRLILNPENKISNPSPFYAKCGLVSTTERGAKEIANFFEKGIPFTSGNSDPMYLPIK